MSTRSEDDMAEEGQPGTQRAPGLPTVRFTPRRYKGAVLLEETEVQTIQKIQVRADDIYVVSFPKSGTTLVQEMTYLVATDLDYRTAADRQLDDRFPFLDIFCADIPFYRGVRYIEDLPSPRLIKSHLPFQVLPKQLIDIKPKVIYIARNPIDAFVSSYYFRQYLCELETSVTLVDFLQQCIDNEVYGSPWLDHVLGFWERRTDSFILFLKYEDVIKDLAGTVRQIAQFLGKTLSEQQVAGVADHCRFSNMQQNTSVNLSYMVNVRRTNLSSGHLVRSGKAGDWKNELGDHMFLTTFRAKLQKDLEGTDLMFENL